MSELKHYDIKDIEAMDDERTNAAKPGRCVPCTRVYIKEDVDETIAELKARVNGHNNRANLWHYNAVNEHNEVVALRAKNAELNRKLAEEKEFGLNRAKSADHEIGKLTEEICDLRKELAELREATRWRKCSEELPPKDGSYMCAYKNKNKDDGVSFVDEAVWDGEKWSYKFDFWEDIIYWQFKPKAPEDK